MYSRVLSAEANIRVCTHLCIKYPHLHDMVLTRVYLYVFEVADAQTRCKTLLYTSRARGVWGRVGCLQRVCIIRP